MGKFSEEVVRKQKKMPAWRVLAYACTEAAGNLVFCTVTTYIMFYYTDVFGLSVAAAGTIMLVVRIFDAFDAPIWGFIIDHTHTRWGQCRPYWLFVAIPFVGFFILMFSSPDLDEGAKFWWALVTYVLFSISYTGVGTPCTSILPNITDDSEERVRLVSRRNLGGQVGYVITAMGGVFIVKFFQDSMGMTLQESWRYYAIVIGILGLAMLWFGFAGTKEVHKPKKSISIAKSILSAKGNWVWFLLVIIFIFYWLGQSSRTAVTMYVGKYVMGDEGYAGVLNTLVMFQVIGMLSIPVLVKKFAKSHILCVSMIVAGLGQLAIFFLNKGPESAMPVYVFWSISSIAMGACISMTFAMLADTVDFGEWKTGIRAVGFLSAVGSSFAIKIGSGVGAWAAAQIMAASGFSADAAVTGGMVDAIWFCFSILPAAFFIVGGLICIRYYKYEKMEPQIKRELIERRGEISED